MDSRFVADYPQLRAAATEALLACVAHLRVRFGQAVDAAEGLLRADGHIDISQVVLGKDCPFELQPSGRAKCDALEGFGRALHGAQDFYAHSNWADESDPANPISVLNPPGLNRPGPSPILDLRGSGVPAVPHDLTTGFFRLPDLCARFNGRVTHACLNKDQVAIDPATGATANPLTPRGRVLRNAEKAVRGAIVETRRQWRDTRDELIARYGPENGGRMIRALTEDLPGPRRPAHLTVTQNAPSSAVPEEIFDYTISVTNSGPGTARNVTVTNVLPADGRFVTTSPDGYGAPLVNAQYHISLGDLVAGDTATATLSWDVAAAAQGTRLTNTAYVRADNARQDGPVTATVQVISTGPPAPASITFDGSPGTAAPPATLGPYTMTPFAPDDRPLYPFEDVSDVNGPTGAISFSQPLTHYRVTDWWDTWSHGYTGDVYFRMGPDSDSVVITLPPGTKAFYFYAEPWNRAATHAMHATAQDGTTSGPIDVNGDGGAKYFGFYAVGTDLTTITITDPHQYSEFAIGEVGIAGAARLAAAPARDGSPASPALRPPAEPRSTGAGNVRSEH